MKWAFNSHFVTWNKIMQNVKIKKINDENFFLNTKVNALLQQMRK